MALQYTTLLFDLDGTLTDSEVGIVGCVRHSLRAFGIEETDAMLLRSFIGPPLHASYRRHYGFSEAQTEAAVALFRERYEATGKFENRPYDGIPELLGRLKAAGLNLMLATSKPEHFARQILAHFDLAAHFGCIRGADDAQGRFEKQHVIETLLREHPQLNRDNTIMIGDRVYDVEGAALCGLDCIGVAYGFGSRDELEIAGAKYIVESVDALGALLLGRNG